LGVTWLIIFFDTPIQKLETQLREALVEMLVEEGAPK